jgi:hypothetical protein
VTNFEEVLHEFSAIVRFDAPGVRSVGFLVNCATDDKLIALIAGPALGEFLRQSDGR